MIGVIHDALLYFHLKGKKKAEEKGHPVSKGVEMIPWKSSNESDNNEIPLRATVISSILLAFDLFLIFVTIYVSSKSTSYTSGWYLITTGLMNNMVRLPITLIFAIKHKRKVQEIKKNQPPTKLQFHDKGRQDSVSSFLLDISVINALKFVKVMLLLG